MKRILVCSPKGGSGKTHLSRNIAVAAAHDGLRVSTADLDPQEALTRWHRRRPDGVPAIGHLPLHWHEAREAARAAVPGADILVIDTPPSLHEHGDEMAHLIQAADVVLVPSRPSWDDVEASVAYLAAIGERGRRPVVVLNATVNRVNSAGEKEALMEVADLCPVEIAQRADYARLGVRGLGIGDLPGHPGEAEFSAVWAFVRGRIALTAPRGKGQGDGPGARLRAPGRKVAA